VCIHKTRAEFFEDIKGEAVLKHIIEPYLEDKESGEEPREARVSVGCPKDGEAGCVNTR
jgi:hypothetical protein